MNDNQDLEMLDVYSEDNKQRIGIAERGVVHYFNLWHREVACWIINNNNEVLLQRRSASKKQQPNKLAITAGHVDLREEPINAAIREIREELGIENIAEKDLIYIDTFKAENKNNYHYKYVYLLKTQKKISELTMQKSEVSELIYVSFDKLLEMISEPKSELTFAKHFYTPLIIEKIKECL